MNRQKFYGTMLRMLRLERSWSQELLCNGICAVSYLSKIEQGKVVANQDLLEKLFAKLDISWQAIPEEESRKLCEALYEQVFSDDAQEIEHSKAFGLLRQEGLSLGVYYLDYLVLRAYCCRDREIIHHDLIELLDSRQKCLLLLLENCPDEALRIFPCALTAKQTGISYYQSQKYALALQFFQQAYDLSSNQGYVKIMMLCQAYMANCYGKLGDYSNMAHHSLIAKRLAAAVNAYKWERTIEYNLASLAVELGKYEEGYHYFSGLDELSVLDAHKLAICCEKLGRRVEALAVLKTPMEQAQGVEKKICQIVWY